MNWSYVSGFCVLGLCLGAGCGPSEPEQRQYREVRVAPEAPPSATPGTLPAEHPPIGDRGSMAAAGAGMSPAVAVSWSTPEGWQEQPGTSVRLVTFLVDGHECTITAFPGDVGGTAANLRRWLGQLQAPAPDETALDAFTAGAPAITSQGGLPGRIYDLGDLLPDPQPDTTSMLAAILTKQDASVFVKFTGPRSVLDAHRERFEALCASLE